MEVFSDAAAAGARLARPVVAIGNFDGVHLGHQRIVQRTRERAAELGAAAAVLTFDPHPARVLAPGAAPPLLQSLRRRLECLEALGVQAVLVQAFTDAFARTPADAFVGGYLAAALGARHVVVGDNFTFGHGARGDAARLAALAAGAGFSVTVVPPVAVEGLAASSTRIRALVAAGDLRGARALLGRPVEVAGQVVPGRGRGRTIGVPTANLAPEHDVLPPAGVYAGVARLGAARHPAAINVGVAPTFGGAGGVTVEAHLLDFSRDVYGERIVLELGQHLRGEQRFASPAALVEQIRRDVARARELAR